MTLCADLGGAKDTGEAEVDFIASTSTQTQTNLENDRVDGPCPPPARRGQAGYVDDDDDAQILVVMRLSLKQERQRADEQRLRWEEDRHLERLPVL
ncbi:hypothetical protein GN958_ATG22389 [Phytophthora infestans]|uniref:Uncharacterized protein n=1 Tax=Phytophthora infestans TaxID=4787 RepID=A0A8S9TP21_PHYIN|nr:hypothetical protein GN958_ATG22389 [Phytophthora infestans]